MSGTEVCAVCEHPERAAIEKMMADGRERYEFLARRFEVGAAELRRHREQHMPDDPGLQFVDAGQMIADINENLRLARIRRAVAAETGNMAAEERAARQIDHETELLARLTGTIGQFKTALSMDQEKTMARIIEALRDYPEARTAVRKALSG